MSKLYWSCLFIMLISTKANSQDLISDSLRSLIVNTKSDSVKASELLELAKHETDLQKNDTAIIVINDARALTRQKGLEKQELESLYLLSNYYYDKSDPGKGYPLILQAISLARQHQLIAQEVDLVIALSNRIGDQSDSVKLLIQQALNLSEQYNIIDQEISALERKGNFYREAKPDSAKYYFLHALSFSRQSHLPDIETNLLQDLAFIYIRNHQIDSANYLMQEALRTVRKNHLADREVTLLLTLIDTYRGFFLKDSLMPYYDRLLHLTRQLHRDSLPIMLDFATSCRSLGNFSKALQTNLIVLHAYEERKDSAAIEKSLFFIGGIYRLGKDFRKSINYYRESEKYGSIHHYIYLFDHVSMAMSYLGLNQHDSARYYADKAYQIALNYYGSANKVYGGVLNDLGTVYFELGEDSLAYDYLRRSYQFFTINSFEYQNYCATTIGLANYFKKAARLDSSFLYASLCLRIAQDKGFLLFITESSGLVADYYREKHNPDSAYHYQEIGFEAYKSLYNDESGRQFQNMSNAEEQREQDIAQARKIATDQFASNLRLYALITVLSVGLLIGLMAFRNSRQKQQSYDLLKKQKLEIDLQKSKLEISLNDLRATQSQLIQSEKMASLGALTAGIAHEIQNPLNFVNNFSDVNKELLFEVRDEMDKGNIEDAKAIVNDVIENEGKINHHGKRADAIVKGMLQHSRAGTGHKESTDINALAEEYLRLAYHGFFAKDKTFHAALQTDFDTRIDKLTIIPQEIASVLLNLYNNSFYAIKDKKMRIGESYEPAVSVSTKKTDDKVIIIVKDNGNGIPTGVVDKIFQPFFTTKPTGQGTGLGLSLSYDIVKAHGGEIKAETSEGESATFIIHLPV